MGELVRLNSGSFLRNPGRTLLLLLVVIGTLVAFMITEAAMRDLAASSIDAWNADPYDMSIRGPGAFSLGPIVGQMVGIRGTQNVYEAPVNLNSFSGKALVLGDGSLIRLKIESGRLPEAPDEIVVDSSVAKRDRLDVGSEAKISRTDDHTYVVNFTVCGIASGIHTDNCVTTKEGLGRLQPSLEQYETVYVARDAAVDLAKTKKLIAELVEGDENLKLVDHGESRYIADSNVYTISAGISWLVLCAGMASFLILLGLYQRDRSYELGVLRALGYNKIAVFLVLSLDALALIAIGLLIGLLGSISVTLAMRLGNISTLIARNGSPTVKVAAASILIATVVSLRTSNSKVTRLLRAER